MPHHLSTFSFQFSPSPAARHYNSVLSIWLSVDPMSDKYPGLSPYTYCGNNPVKLVDPNGRTVVTEDKQSRDNIRYTLTIKEARYVQFDKNGVLNDRKLQRCKSTSENVTALKALSRSDTKYHFQVSEETHEGDRFFLPDDNHNYFYGVTEVPFADMDPSPNEDVWILISNLLDRESAVANVAHEAYGHAYFYELQQQGFSVNYLHTRGTQIDDDGDWCYTLNNSQLERQIEIVTNQAINNYRSHIKKQ